MARGPARLFIIARVLYAQAAFIRHTITTCRAESLGARRARSRRLEWRNSADGTSLLPFLSFMSQKRAVTAEFVKMKTRDIRIVAANENFSLSPQTALRARRL